MSDFRNGQATGDTCMRKKMLLATHLRFPIEIRTTTTLFALRAVQVEFSLPNL
jgi:hypothetical protein